MAQWDGGGPVAQQAASCGTDMPTYIRERPGLSAFALENGLVYHTYSAYARGLDVLPRGAGTRVSIRHGCQSARRDRDDARRRAGSCQKARLPRRMNRPRDEEALHHAAC